jgi:hypothetical protein
MHNKPVFSLSHHIMYADRLPLPTPRHTCNADLCEDLCNDDQNKTEGVHIPIKTKHLWIRLRQILSNTTSYYRKRGMRLPKSPAEENNRLRSDLCCFNATPDVFCRSRLMMLRDQLALSSDLGQSVSEAELERVLLTIAAAILNPST